MCVVNNPVNKSAQPRREIESQPYFTEWPAIVSNNAKDEP
jgi:hypothetical protein